MRSTTSINESKKFFVYLRQSKKGNSWHTFDVQLRTIQQFAQQRGFPLDKTNSEIKQEDASAYEGSRRRFEEMIHELEIDSKKEYDARRYDGILFFNVSRLARNAEDFVRIEQLMKKGYKMLSATEHIIDSPSGMYFFRMIQIESIYYSDRQSSKSQSYSLHILSERPCQAIGGNGTTYGYRIKNGDIQIHPLNSLIVKRIYELKKLWKSHESIAEIIEKEFSQKVNEYNLWNRLPDNSKIIEEGYDEDVESMVIPQNEDDESIDFSEQKPKIREFWIQAHIPNSKKISDILGGRGSVQYDGRRQCKFNLNFEEDVKLYKSFMDSKMFRFRFENGGTFKKGENILILDVPELRIIEPEIFNHVAEKKIVRGRMEWGHIYNGVVFCECGMEMRGKVEGRLWKVYYQCSEAIKKRSLCKNTTRIEEKHIHFHIQSHVFPHLGIEEGSEEFQKCLNLVKSMRTENLSNRLKTENGALTKLKKGLKDIKTVDLKESYDEKIKEKEDIIKTLKVEIERALEKAEDDYYEYAREFEEFASIEKEHQAKLIHDVFVKIIMKEEHSDFYRYDNPYNRRSVQYQKLASYELTPYYQSLFDTNFPYEQQ